MAKASKTTTTVTDTKETNMSDQSIFELGQSLEDFDDFAPLPAGTYPAEVRKAEAKISEKGNEYYTVTFVIHPDDYPADYDISNAPEGTILSYSRLMKPTLDNRRSISSMKKFYRALGLSLKTSKINPGDWEGKKARIVVGLSMYNGETRNEIKSIEANDD